MTKCACAAAAIAFALTGAAVPTAAAVQSTLVTIPPGQPDPLGPLPDRGEPIPAPEAPASAAPAAAGSVGVPPSDVVDDGTPGASQAVRQLTDWVIASRDNNDLPFMIIDKVAAEVFVHDSDGELIGAGPALLGLAKSDVSVPGVGKRKLSLIGNDEKTTPAGRFVARFGPASGHERVLWVDYADSVAMHPVITTNPKEKRMQRLKSPTPNDNRITFGCINVFPAFYKEVVKPTFKGKSGIVYILPETKTLGEVFLAFQPMAGPAGR
jgi:hypothetical protein